VSGATAEDFAALTRRIEQAPDPRPPWVRLQPLRTRNCRLGPEDTVQAEVVRAIEAEALRGAPLLVASLANATAIPGTAGMLVATRLKATGLLPGAPDLIVVFPGGIGFLETKRPKGGLLGPKQALFRDTCTAWGIPWALVRSADEALDALLAWGAPTMGARR
jgi:hypothetical protein